jgi:hypothetical protein
MTAPDHKPDGSGLDDGPWLPGKGPRAKAAPKSKEQLAAIRAKAWATRRAGLSGGGHEPTNWDGSGTNNPSDDGSIHLRERA